MLDKQIKRAADHIDGFGVTLGAAVKSCEIVTHLSVDRLDGGCEGLGLDEQRFGDDAAIDLPVVCRHGEGLKMGYPCPEPLQRLATTSAHFDGEDTSREPRHSNPYPKLALFFWV